MSKVQRYNFLSSVFRRIGKARDGDIFVLDPAVFSAEDIERIRKHVEKTAHPRSRVLFVSARGGIKHMNVHQIRMILKRMEKYGEGTEEDGGKDDTGEDGNG